MRIAQGAVERSKRAIPTGPIMALGQFASKCPEDFFRCKRPILHVFDWPAHEETDAKEGEIDLDAAGNSADSTS